MDYYEKKLSKNGSSMRAFAFCIVSVFVMFTALFLTSCKAIQYVPVPEYHHDSIYTTKYQYDSIYKHDSILVEKYAYGDTLYIETTKWHTRYKYKLIHDTLYSEKIDSVTVPTPIEKKLTKWQQVKIDYGGEAIVILFVMLGLLMYLVIIRQRK